MPQRKTKFGTEPRMPARRGSTRATLRRTLTTAFPLLLAISLLGCGAGSNSDQAQKPAAKPAIVFMTDFGTANDAVAICKAVIVGIAPDARIMDITHQVTPFQIDEAARFLAGVTPY